jgi:N-acyl-D-aspartate/D-glutamate deacylase
LIGGTTVYIEVIVMNEEVDYLLKNAIIVDGMNNNPFTGSITILHGKINKIYKDGNLPSYIKAKKVIDVTSKYLIPGFIDFHGHSDLQVIRDPSMKCKIQQGITTEIAGNCGVGVFPIDINNKDIVDLINNNTKDVLGEGIYSSSKFNWHDFETYTNYVKKEGSGTNIMYLQSHTALRCNAISGNPNREATKDELERMCELLDISLSQGCVGFSSGLYYAPCLYASKEELVALLKVVKKHNKYFAVHHRCEGDDVIKSLEEILELARITGVKLEISHLKAIGGNNQQYVPKMLSIINEALKEGIDVGFDQYPYNFGSTSLSSLLPPSYLKLSHSDLKSALNNESDRAKMKSLIIKGVGFDSIIKMCGFESISIMYSEHFREFDGLTLLECSDKLYGKHDEESMFNSFFDILRDEDGICLMKDITQSIESMQKILRDTLMVFGTDSLYSGGTLPTHPRSYHSVPHYLSLFYKQLHTLSIEELVYRATGKSAKRLNLIDRGIIKEGYYADLVVCDLDNLEDLSNDNTQQPSKGIDEVFVNGKHVYSMGDIINKPSGEIITFK